MRIAMLATSRNPIVEPYAGGQESHTAMLARGLRRVGHHVRLYARAGTDPATSDEFVRRMWAFFAALPPGEFPHTVELAAQLARSSTDDQFQFGIRTFLAEGQAASRRARTT